MPQTDPNIQANDVRATKVGELVDEAVEMLQDPSPHPMRDAQKMFSPAGVDSKVMLALVVIAEAKPKDVATALAYAPFSQALRRVFQKTFCGPPVKKEYVLKVQSASTGQSARVTGREVECLTVAAAAKRLGLGEDTVRRYCNSETPKLAASKPNRDWLIPVGEVERYYREVVAKRRRG